MGTIFFTAILTLAQIATVFLGFRQAAPDDKQRAILLSAIAAVAALGLVILSIKPQFDYARLDLRPTIRMSPDGKAVFFFRATNDLQWVSYAQGKTNDPTDPRLFDFIPLIRKGEESIPRKWLEPGDWTFDIDAVNEYGKISQRVIFESEGGLPKLTFMRVTRKPHAILCQTPKRRFTPLCE